MDGFRLLVRNTVSWKAAVSRYWEMRSQIKGDRDAIDRTAQDTRKNCGPEAAWQPATHAVRLLSVVRGSRSPTLPTLITGRSTHIRLISSASEPLISLLPIKYSVFFFNHTSSVSVH